MVHKCNLSHIPIISKHWFQSSFMKSRIQMDIYSKPIHSQTEILAVCSVFCHQTQLVGEFICTEPQTPRCQIRAEKMKTLVVLVLLGVVASAFAAAKRDKRWLTRVSSRGESFLELTPLSYYLRPAHNVQSNTELHTGSPKRPKSAQYRKSWNPCHELVQCNHYTTKLS